MTARHQASRPLSNGCVTATPMRKATPIAKVTSQFCWAEPGRNCRRQRDPIHIQSEFDAIPRHRDPQSGSGTTAVTGRSLGVDNRLANCELRAQLAGYSSQSINLTSRTPLDNPDVGTILIHKMGASETATTVTATTLKASKEARKALQKGLDLAKKNKPEEAIASLQEAVKVDPDFAFAWCELGKLQLENDHIPDAHESFEAAVKAEPRWPEPYLHLALMGVKAHDWREVVATTDQVLRLNSYEYPGAYFFNAAANYNLRHVGVAEKSALAAERVDVQHEYRKWSNCWAPSTQSATGMPNPPKNFAPT